MNKILITTILIVCTSTVSVKSQNTVHSAQIPQLEQPKPDRNMLGKSIYKVFIKDGREVNRIDYKSLIHIGFKNSKVARVRVIEQNALPWDLDVFSINNTDLGLEMVCKNKSGDTFNVVMRPIEDYHNIWKQAGGDIIFLEIKSNILHIGYIMVEADKSFVENFTKSFMKN